MADSTASEAVEPPISLETYAFVTAGLADRLELNALLEYRAVDPRDWNQGNEIWVERILDDLDEGAELSLQVDTLRQKAREHWWRPIPPLDDDLRAWLDFQRGLAELSDPIDYLESIPLTAGEIGALARLWGQRFATEPVLIEQARAILAEPLEPVTVPAPPPAKLKARDDQGSLDGTGFFSPFMDDNTLPFAGEKKDELQIAPPLSVPLPKPPVEPGDDLDGTSALGFDVAVFDFPFAAARDEAPAPPPPPLGAPAADPVLIDVSGAVDAGAPEIPASAPPPTPTSEAGLDSTGFLDAASLGLGDELPFADAPDAVPQQQAPSEAGEAARDAIGTTAFLEPGVLDLGPDLPFDDGAVDSASSAAPAAHEAVDQTGFLDASSLGLDDELPFQPGPARPAPAHDSAPHDALGETGFLDTGSIDFSEPLPIQQSDTQHSPHATPARSTAPAFDVNQRLMQELPHTLAHFAAISVEIELAPRDASQILSRYQLDSHSHAQLDHALRSLIAANPSAAAAWREACATYRAWRASSNRG